MKRRRFIQLMAMGLAYTGIGANAPAGILQLLPQEPRNPSAPDRWIKDYLYKIRHFNEPHPQDRILEPALCQALFAVRDRLLRIQQTVGHGNFHLLDFDEALQIARNYSRVGPFSREEIDFMEMIFYEDASSYGFYGKKPLLNLTEGISKSQVVALRETGNYLYRGQPIETYEKICRAIGEPVVLTSGIRSIMKQFLLFSDKACESEGNLSMASRSLAPPGYSFHSVGDFDVGQAGFGALNFTEQFAHTEVFQRLTDLGYVRLRYERDNLLGVRFEPWHIQVTPCV